MILGIITILLIATALSIHFRKTSVECLPMSVFGIIFILYLFGIINLLVPGLILIVIIGILSLFYITYNCIKKKINLFNFLSIGILFFLGMIFFVYMILKGSKIICYDEFTAWGLFVKTSLESNQLYIYSPFQALAKGYQAGTAIFQIFIESLNFKFSEDLLFVSMNIIYFSMASIILINLKIKNLLELITRSLIIIIIPLSFFMWPINYYTILVDVILGFAFAYIIYYYFTNKLNKFTLINIALAIFFLTCSKGNGLVLGIMAICIIYLDLFLFRRDIINKYLKSTHIKERLIIALPIISILFTFLSWTICLKILGIKPLQDQVGSLIGNTFSTDFISRLPSYMLVVQNKFIEYRNYIFLIIGILVTLLSVHIKNNRLLKHHKRYIIMVLFYIFLNLGYLFFLFIICNSMATEAIATDALRRYIFTLISANITLITFGFIYISHKSTKLNISLLLLAVIFTATPANNQFETFIKGDYTTQYIEYRKQFEPIVEKLAKVDKNHDIIYYINEAEVDRYISNFVSFPIELSPIPYWYDDVSYNNYSKLLLSKNSIELFSGISKTKYELKKHNDKKTGNIYIYIYKVTDGAHKRYSPLFTNSGLVMSDNTLYLITSQNENIKLSLVE